MNPSSPPSPTSPLDQLDLFGRIISPSPPAPRPDRADSAELTEEEIDALDEQAKASMKLAIEQGRQKATLDVGTRVRVGSGLGLSPSAAGRLLSLQRAEPPKTPPCRGYRSTRRIQLPFIRRRRLLSNSARSWPHRRRRSSLSHNGSVGTHLPPHHSPILPPCRPPPIPSLSFPRTRPSMLHCQSLPPTTLHPRASHSPRASWRYKGWTWCCRSQRT